MPHTLIRRDRSAGKDRARAIVKAWENGAPRLRVGADGKVYDANPLRAGMPRAGIAKKAKPASKKKKPALKKKKPALKKPAAKR